MQRRSLVWRGGGRGGVAEVLGVGEKFRKGGGSGNRCGRLKEVPLTAPDIIV